MAMHHRQEFDVHPVLWRIWWVLSGQILKMVGFQAQFLHQIRSPSKLSDLIQHYPGLSISYVLLSSKPHHTWSKSKTFLQLDLYQRWILKKLFCIAASLKSVMVTTNSAQNLYLGDFFSS